VVLCELVLEFVDARLVALHLLKHLVGAGVRRRERFCLGNSFVGNLGEFQPRRTFALLSMTSA